MHAANLVASLNAARSSLHFIGMGGPYLRAQKNFESLFSIEELSVMGATEVLRHLPRILGLLGRIKQTLAERRPVALIVVDAPSFHFRVIKAARQLGIPVYYYISPKVWAWNESRAFFIKKNVRRLISILPFEVAFYKRFGVDIDYVGNPLVDMIDWPRIKDIAPLQGKIGLLPGSRMKEITSLVPEFGKAARILLQRLPHLSFHMVRAPNLALDDLQRVWPKDVPITFEPPDDRYAFMRSCQMLIAASGTVTFEAALTRTPALVTYKVSPLTFFLGKMLVKIPYASLSNIILGKALFPELLQHDCDGPKLAAKALEWLAPKGGVHPLESIREELADLAKLVGNPGATKRAATVILNDFDALQRETQGLS